MSLDIINNYILENKELIRKYICKRSTCSYYITKGKYKNNICGRKVMSEDTTLCKVHSKYTAESKEVPIETEVVGIELVEFIYKEKSFLKTKDNIVYGKFERGYFPVGEYIDNEIIYYK